MDEERIIPATLLSRQCSVTCRDPKGTHGESSMLGGHGRNWKWNVGGAVIKQSFLVGEQSTFAIGLVVQGEMSMRPSPTTVRVGGES